MMKTESEQIRSHADQLFGVLVSQYYRGRGWSSLNMIYKWIRGNAPSVKYAQKVIRGMIDAGYIVRVQGEVLDSYKIAKLNFTRENIFVILTRSYRHERKRLKVHIEPKCTDCKERVFGNMSKRDTTSDLDKKPGLFWWLARIFKRKK